jgi:regulator of nucleoside diphosphate kinase
MTDFKRAKMNARPKIIISSLDAERLEKLLDSLPGNAFPGKDDLAAELARAEVVEPKEIPPAVVTMNSTVRFKVRSTSQEFELTLVYPKDADSSGRTISILAPVGSALLGLAQGDEIEWPKPGGGVLHVRIEEVTYQPERAGEYHR